MFRRAADFVDFVVLSPLSTSSKLIGKSTGTD